MFYQSLRGYMFYMSVPLCVYQSLWGTCSTSHYGVHVLPVTKGVHVLHVSTAVCPPVTMGIHVLPVTTGYMFYMSVPLCVYQSLWGTCSTSHYRVHVLHVSTAVCLPVTRGVHVLHVSTAVCLPVTMGIHVLPFTMGYMFYQSLWGTCSTCQYRCVSTSHYGVHVLHVSTAVCLPVTMVYMFYMSVPLCVYQSLRGYMFYMSVLLCVYQSLGGVHVLHVSTAVCLPVTMGYMFYMSVPLYVYQSLWGTCSTCQYRCMSTSH